MRSACSAENFVHRLILQKPVGLDVDIVTTLEEKEGGILRKWLMHMYKVIMFMNEKMRESVSADGKFVASWLSESMEVLTNIT